MFLSEQQVETVKIVLVEKMDSFPTSDLLLGVDKDASGPSTPLDEVDYDGEGCTKKDMPTCLVEG